MVYLSRRRGDRLAALALTLTVFAASWFRHATFRSTNYDLAVVEQTLWKLSHGRGATSSLTAWNAFADHLSPILLAFAPLYRLAATPLWLFGAQAVAMGVGLLAVRPLARAAGLDERGWHARALVVAFALSPGLWNAALFDFHATTLAVPVVMIGLTAALRSQHRVMWLCLGALCLLRDDLAVAGAAIAVIGWRHDPAGRRSRALLIGAAVAWTGFGAVLGAAMGSTRHWDARYGYLGDSAVDAARHLPQTLLALAQHVFVADNMLPLLALLVPLAFLPLGRPAWLGVTLVLALPILAAEDPNFTSPAYHYAAPLVPFLLAAAASTLGTNPVWGRKTAPGAAVRPQTRLAMAGVVVAMAGAGFAAVGPPATGALRIPHADATDVARALATITPTDRVVATNYVGAHLAHRERLLPFPAAIAPVAWTFPLDPRVTAATEETRDNIDVVIVSWPVIGTEADVMDQAVAQLDKSGFEPEQFGTVTVYRRNQNP